MILSQGSASDDGFKAGGSTVPTGTDLHAAEQFVMQVQNFAATHVLSLIDLLPSDPVPRGPTCPESFAWLTGAYSKGPLKGLRRNVHSFPRCTAALCRLLSKAFPGEPFAAAAIFQNVKADLHVDRNNLSTAPNLLLPVSKFTGGDVWFKDDAGSVPFEHQGQTLMGSLCEVSQAPCLLNAQLPHATLPWQGRRVLVVGYTPANVHELDATDVALLQKLGFVLPTRAQQERSPSLPSSEPSCFQKPQNEDLKDVEESPPLKQQDAVVQQTATFSAVIRDDPLVLFLSLETDRVVACARHLGLSSAISVSAFAHAASSACLQADLSCPGDSALCAEWLMSPRLAGIIITDNGGWSQQAAEFILSAQASCMLRGVFVLRLGTHACCEGLQLGRLCPKCSGDASEFSVPWAASPDIAPWVPSSCSCAIALMHASCERFSPRMSLTLAASLCHYLVSKGWAHMPASADFSDERLQLVLSRAVNHLQPKAARMPPLVSEHERVVVMTAGQAFPLPCPVMSRLQCPWPVPQHASCELPLIPKDSQLLRFTPLGAKGGVGPGSGFELAWGVPRSPADFAKQALISGHPRTFPAILPAQLKEALNASDCMTAAEVAEHRVQKIKAWVSLAAQLEEDEEKLKQSLDPEVRAIVSPKRILLWEALLKQSGFPDLNVVKLLTEGVHLTGHAPISGMFKPKFRPMKMTVSKAKSISAESCAKILESVKSQGDLDVEVFQKTLEEKEAGWLEGPLPLDSLGPGMLLSRRFGLQQGPKVRLIDNLTASLVNLLVQAYESPQPQSTDVVAALVQALLQKKRQGTLLGKAFDLKAAYRQLAIAPESRWASFIACACPNTKRPTLFRMKALPFGSAMAVYAFLRVALSLWRIATTQLLIPWTNFFDDFVTFAPSNLASNTDDVICTYFKLLGWLFAEQGDKAKPFAQLFSALGISVDLRNFLSGQVFFTNTERRIAELQSSLQAVLSAGRLPSWEALRLRGRLQFADGQLFGRSGRGFLQALTDHAYFGQGETLSPNLRHQLKRCL